MEVMGLQLYHSAVYAKYVIHVMFRVYIDNMRNGQGFGGFSVL